MKTILVVEDDAINAVVFRRVIEKRGDFKVIVTESAEEVLAVTRSGEISLVVMDVSLGRSALDGRPVNGVDLCRMIKSDAVTASIPVLLATAHAMRGDAERLVQESGADGYVAKPIVDHAGFVQRISDMIREAA
jgi:CheY-like chemotaxis protein